MRKFLPGLCLFLFASYYCHRFYGAFFSLEGDAHINIYFRLYPELVRADHNPYQFHYMSHWMPHYGLFNPLLHLAQLFLRFFGVGSDVGLALYTNMVASVLCLWVLSLSLYFLFRFGGLSRGAGLLATTITTYSGFHLVGVREFDFFYLMSFAAVGPSIVACIQLQRGVRPACWVVLLALVVGLSLLGGSHVPLFYFLPMLFLIPFLGFLFNRNHRLLWKGFVYQVLGVGLGCLLAFPVLIRGLSSLAGTNRSDLQFAPESMRVEFLDFITTLFWRDAWVLKGLHYHERDFFIGLPVLILCFLGWRAIQSKRAISDLRSFLFISLMLTSLVIGFVMLNYFSFPSFLQELMAKPLSWVSIRFPNRFFLMALLPIGYLAGVGFDRAQSRGAHWAFLLLLGLYLFCGVLKVYPVWNHQVLDVKIATLFGQLFGLVAFALFFWGCFGGFKPTAIWRRTVILVVFLMYALSPNTLSQYPALRAHLSAKGAAPEQRLSWAHQLGFIWNYAFAYEATYDFFKSPPDYLANPMTRKGRVLDLRGVHPKVFFHAPQSEHRVAFDYAGDPATPFRIDQLRTYATPSILDLYGVCHYLSGHHPVSVVERTSCLPEVFLVDTWKRFSQESQLLSWLRRTPSATFKKFVGVWCGEAPCHERKNNTFLHRRKLRQKSAIPGKWEFEVGPGKEQALFLSTVYKDSWRAYLDGKERPIYRANYAFMAVDLGNESGLLVVTLDRKKFQYADVFGGILFLGLSFVFLLERFKRFRVKFPWQTA